MQICRLSIENFRGIKKAVLRLPKHGVLLGDNNTGKTTILEAMDLVLGPDRLNRIPCVDEHDFFQGRYVAVPTEAAPTETTDATAPADAPVVAASAEIPVAQDPPRIVIEVAISHLTEEQRARFGDYVEFWNTNADAFYADTNAEGVDAAHITEALRVTFIGRYDQEEDDFEGKTYFTRTLSEDETPTQFSKKDKQFCGFLYLRSLRTGARALSLERGSLLDIILKRKKMRPQMWEDTIKTLSSFTVATDPKLGIAGVLESINASLKRYVPKEWGVEPHLKISDQTREHLRKVITAFIATGEGDHAAPFYRQGTGTINMLVLAMLTQIAQDKQNVIFAMEEPETAIPPYAQKRIVHEVRKLASQAIFTSHSPYVLEEFSIDETIVLARNGDGLLTRSPLSLPVGLKLKRYRQDFRTRFCEALLARRVLVAEGATESTAFPVVCRRLSELNPELYQSLEALGICTIDAGGDGRVCGLATFYKSLGKRVFALCDKLGDEMKASIEAQTDALYMHEEKGFENLVLKQTTEAALVRFAKSVAWPQHLGEKYPDPTVNVRAAMSEYFTGKKAEGAIADFLAQCNEDEIPQWLRDCCVSIAELCEPTAEPETAGPAIAAGIHVTGSVANAADQ